MNASVSPFVNLSNVIADVRKHVGEWGLEVPLVLLPCLPVTSHLLVTVPELLTEAVANAELLQLSVALPSEFKSARKFVT